MMDFIMLTVSITVSILLASVLSVCIMLNKKVVNWYMKRMFKMMKDFDGIVEEELSKDL